MPLSICVLFWILIAVALCFQGVVGAPSFYNLPNSQNVDENIAVASDVFTIEILDDTGSDRQVWWQPNPPEGSRLFDLGPVVVNKSVVTTKTDIDFEELTATSFVFTVYLTDNTSLTATNTLTLSVRDLNEPVTWNRATYTTTVPDGASVGYAVQNPGFATTDPDVGDSVVCSMNCSGNNGYFSISPSCNITVTSVYSLDVTGSSNSITCDVIAVDDGSNSATATLTISIDDVNNYTPVFAPVSYQFTVSPYDPVDTAIGTVTATDEDSGSFGNFSYSIDQSAYPTHYFKINSTSGQISTQLDMSTCVCPLTTFSIPVHATDQGGLVGSADVYITTGTTTTTTTTAAAEYKTFFDDSVNLAWFTVVIVLIFFTLCVTAFVLFKYVFKPATQHARKSVKLALNDGNKMKRLPTTKSVRKPPPPRSFQAWRHEDVF